MLAEDPHTVDPAKIKDIKIPRAHDGRGQNQFSSRKCAQYRENIAATSFRAVKPSAAACCGLRRRGRFRPSHQPGARHQGTLGRCPLLSPILACN